MGVACALCDFVGHGFCLFGLQGTSVSLVDVSDSDEEQERKEEHKEQWRKKGKVGSY